VIAAAGALLLFAAVAFASYFSVLRYRGHSLDYWVTKLKQGNQREKSLAREAMQHFGPRAMPSLIEVLERQDPAWKLNLIKRFPPLYRCLRATWPQDRAYAAVALGELGRQATDAIPALERLALTIGPAYEPAVEAALMKIKGEPLTAVIDGLAKFDAPKWSKMALIVAEFGTNARPALPVLCKALNAPSSYEHWAAAYAIGHICSDAALCVPALVENVKTGRRDDYLNSIWALGEFEADARAAIPMLWQKVKDPDAIVQQGALGSLKRILPPEQQASLLPALKASASDPDSNLSGAAKHMLREMRAAGVK
jgi:HEAT repeat protein